MIQKRNIARVFAALLEAARYKGAYGGRGSGKSHFFGEQLVEDCLAHRGMLAVCIREVQKTLAQSSKRLIEHKIRTLGVGSQFRVYKDKIETPGGGLIIFTGMQDRAVNNSARQVLADVRGLANDLVWFQYGIGDGPVSHAYISGTSTKVSGANVTAAYHAGRRVRAVGASTGTIYGSITSSSYSAPDTTVNYAWDSGALVSESLAISISQVPVTGAALPADAVSNVEASLASATTTDLGSLRNSRINVTGTTAITGFGTGANLLRIVRFSGALTLTHNATSLILLGGASRTTAAGDIGVYGSDSSGNWREISYAKANGAAVSNSALRGYLAGLAISNNGGTPNTKIDVAAGVCTDSTNLVSISCAASTIDCGTTGANGLDIGSLANSTWYHAFAIMKSDGTQAYLASTSATSPTLPSGYIYLRRIGSFRTDGSSHIVAFKQQGDNFWWAALSIDQNNATIPTTSGSFTLNVPSGVQVYPVFFFSCNPLDNTSRNISMDNGTGSGLCPFLVNVTLANNNGSSGQQIQQFITDTSQHLRWQDGLNTNNQGRVYTYGWIDRRGKT